MYRPGILPTALVLATLAFAVPIFMGGVARGQDVNGYDIIAPNDIFMRETVQALGSTSTEVLPLLDCAVEYIRRFEGRDITYRRGPIPLHQANPLAFAKEIPVEGTQPVSEADLQKKFFIGGLVVDVPRAGEAAGHVSSSDDRTKYMIRASIAPLAYAGRSLRARILLERAVVTLDGTILTVQQSEVFSRIVDIVGNEPLHFALPTWEPLKNSTDEVVPSSLDEALIITLETPRHFGFSRNSPEPFSASTRLSYAVPATSVVTLSVVVNGSTRVLDQGRREAGVYQIPWDAASVPDGKYTATLHAIDSAGGPMFTGTLDVTKDKTAGSYTPTRLPAIAVGSPGRISISTESGFAYQFPVDQKKSLRHMFTHIGIRVGYRISHALELGIMGGQDSFHETPGPQVDVDRINEYGGVVAYTYGYVGPYARLTLGGSTVQPIIHASAAFSNVSTITEIGIGVRVMLFHNIGVFAVPSAVSHLKSEVSTKIGVHYGIGVVF